MSPHEKKGYEVVAEFSCRGLDACGPLGLTGGLNRKHPDKPGIERATQFCCRSLAIAAG